MFVCSFYQHQEVQKEVLARQLKLALEINKPIVIHSRESEADILTELEKVRPLQSSVESPNVLSGENLNFSCTDPLTYGNSHLLKYKFPLQFLKGSYWLIIDLFRGACAVKGNVQVAGRTSSVSTTEMLSTHNVSLGNGDGSLFHINI